MKLFALVIAGILAIGSAAPAFAHGGGLDANRCHTNHKTGVYHCH